MELAIRLRSVTLAARQMDVPRSGLLKWCHRASVDMSEWPAAKVKNHRELSDGAVREIRAAPKAVPAQELAERFNVNRGIIYAVRNGYAYRNVQ